MPAFSDRALKQQEPLFNRYVDQLVSKLKDGIDQDANTKYDMVRMYNFTTFDVMGDLTFGEPLHMLDNAEYDPWVSRVHQHLLITSPNILDRTGQLDLPKHQDLHQNVHPNTLPHILAPHQINPS